MAKAKKKEELSLEERLEQALVPIEEQPYELPENWCWVKHNSILDISGGSQPAKSHFISEPAEGYTQLYQTRDYGENPVPVYIPDKYATKTTKEGDILLARYGGSLGKVFRAHEGAYNVALAKVIKLYPELIDDEFLYKYYLAQFYQNFCIKASSGRSAQAGFNREDMDSIPFPLPPLAEQQRIVEQIESLFAKLDEAKDKVQDALDSFEGRKNAILYKALSGAYTRAWRDENNISLDDWNEYTIEEICANIVDCPHTTPEWTEEGILCLRTTNIKLGYFDFTETQYVSDDTYHERTERLVPQEGDLIFTREGSVGDVAIVPANTKLCLGQRMMLMRTSERCLPEYLLFFLISPFIRNYIKENIMGTTAPRMNIKDIKKFKIHVPPVEEQEEIIKVIKPLLQNDADSKELADIRYSIDMLKKSILGKAFRGELGTNDSSEENSIELLKVIMKE